MINQKVLAVATYPIARPEHGGQKRLHAIVQEYKDNFKHVRFSGVYFKGFYQVQGPGDIAVGPASEQQIHASPFTGDMVCGNAIYDDPRVRKKFTALLKGFRPDIIHLEQPWPYLGLKRLLNDLGMQPKLVFGTQNIEAPMKREILEGTGTAEDVIKEVEDQIAQLEREVAAASDLVVACTPADAATLKQMGAGQVVVARNGIAASHATNQAAKHWQETFENLGVDKTVLFVASAHPPSWTGFFDMVGRELGFLPADTRLVAAGSICDYFATAINPDNFNLGDATFWLRAYSAGRLSEDRLVALIERADVILLPITEGGGSNLKTAEAILADKKVVATEHALRSFEWFKDFPNLWIANNKTDFRRAITEALTAEFKPRTAAQSKQARQVLWQQCLRDFMEKVKTI